MPNERTTFRSKDVTLLTCKPGNFDHADGEPATIITVMGNSTGDIEPLVINLADTRTLIVNLLGSLWTNDDEFAGDVLRAMFPCDDDGYFHWPSVD